MPAAPVTPATVPAASEAQIHGVWFITTYLGDPSDPNTPTVQGALTLHNDRTALLTATDHTGTHPNFPGLSTPASGTWKPIPAGIEFRLFEFNNGPNPPSTFGVLRISAVTQFEGPGQMSGIAGVDVLPCPNGAQGCPDPNSSPFPPANALPFDMVRFR